MMCCTFSEGMDSSSLIIVKASCDGTVNIPKRLPGIWYTFSIMTYCWGRFKFSPPSLSNGRKQQVLCGLSKKQFHKNSQIIGGRVVNYVGDILCWKFRNVIQPKKVIQWDIVHDIDKRFVWKRIPRQLQGCVGIITFSILLFWTFEQPVNINALQ